MSETLDNLFDVLSKLADRASFSISITVHPSAETSAADGHSSAEPEPDQPHDRTASFELLKKRGVNGDALIELAARHSPHRIRQCIVGVNGQVGVKNPNAYLIKALNCGYYKNLDPGET